MWTLIMWLSKVLHGLATIILVTIERLDPDASDGFFAIYSFFMRTYTYVVDFLNMSTLIIWIGIRSKSKLAMINQNSHRLGNDTGET